MADPNVTVRFGATTKDLDDAIQRSRSLISQFGDAVKVAFAVAVGVSLANHFKDVGDSASDASKKIKDGWTDTESVTDQLLAPFAALGSAVTSVGEHYAELTRQMATVVDPVRKAAGDFDQTTQTISAIGGVAARAGVSLQDLGKSFHDLQANAKKGNEDTVAALDAIGVKASDIADLTHQQLAVKMADAFSSAKDSANKAASGAALFGDSVAAKLVPQLDGGAARMAELAGMADRTGQALGPEFVAKIQGTEALLQVSADRVAEFKSAWDGFFQSFKMEEFAQIKGALDGLVQGFNDLSRNILDVAEYLTGLHGAGQKTSDDLGLIGTAAKYAAEGIIYAVSQMELLFASLGGTLQGIGVAVKGLANAVDAFCGDIAGAAAAAAGALFQSFDEAIGGVIKLFGDLAQAGKAALSFDLSGASEAFSRFGSDVGSVASKIRSTMSPDLFGGTRAAMADFENGMRDQVASVQRNLELIRKQRDAQLALVQAGGKKGPAVPQTEDVGDPSAPDKDKNADALAAALKRLDGEVQAAKDAEKQRQELLEAGVRLHMLSEDQKVAATRSALDAEFAAERSIYQRELALDGLKLAQRQEILNKLQQATATHNHAVLRLQIEAAEQTQRTWDSAMSEINSAFTSQIDGLLRGTTTFGQAFRYVLGTMLTDVVKFLVEWSLKHAETIAENVAGINAQTAAQVAGAAAGTSAQTAGAAASGFATLAAVEKSIAASASETFAGIFGFLAPVLGPAAAGPAAAGEATVMAAAAAIPSFDVGAWSLPSDMVAQVHAGEMIVPAGPAALMRAAAGGGGGQSTPAPPGAVFNLNVSAMDTRSFGAALTSPVVGQIFQAFDKHMARHRMTWLNLVNRPGGMS